MDLVSRKCVPCEEHETPFTRPQSEKYLKQVSGWDLVQEGVLKIRKNFKFKNFAKALGFVNKVGEIAEKEGHHPDICFGWGKVEITLYTHAIGGLFENDFILASKINRLYGS